MQLFHSCSPLMQNVAHDVPEGMATLLSNTRYIMVYSESILRIKFNLKKITHDNNTEKKHSCPNYQLNYIHDLIGLDRGFPAHILGIHDFLSIRVVVIPRFQLFASLRWDQVSLPLIPSLQSFWRVLILEDIKVLNWTLDAGEQNMWEKLPLGTTPHLQSRALCRKNCCRSCT